MTDFIFKVIIYLWAITLLECIIRDFINKIKKKK